MTDHDDLNQGGMVPEDGPAVATTGTPAEPRPAGDQQATPHDAPAMAGDGADSEADILRTELKRMRERQEELQEQLEETTDRLLRSRAEMETMRRRLMSQVEHARDEGKDEVLAPVLAVYDDLERALAVAAESHDPGSIVTGVELVKENLERQLASLGIRRVGQVGEHFDPHLHEALTTVPAAPGLTAGQIAQVFQPGFVQGERLVRVARVVVVAEHAS